jgi:hypothetical protein
LDPRELLESLFEEERRVSGQIIEILAYPISDQI